MTVSWYQSLIKVLLSRFPQSCRHFQSPDLSTQYLVSALDLSPKGETAEPFSEMTCVLTQEARPSCALEGNFPQAHTRTLTGARRPAWD